MGRGERILVCLCLLFAGVVFVSGIQWGLPSRESDKYLFGEREPWTGAEIVGLAPFVEDPNRGADVDADPLVDRHHVLVLNETDRQRAEIVRRYRLFTHQPDEYNTLKSLSAMKPGALELDPRMYQYGGLWVYPVGALLKVASMVGLIDLRTDKTFYLDHPEEFARFYVAARSYSAAWGVVGAWAVYRLARKLAGAAAPAAVATVCWACMPVILTMAHEAKPHLAGLSLMLLAILAAGKYVETGTTRWWVVAGALCGAATGMVISSASVFVILPVMTLPRPVPRTERVRITLYAGLLGLIVYAITNPYVWINLFRNPGVLKSNLGTSTAMYQATGGSGLVNALRLISEGASLPIALVGGLGLLVLLIPRLHRALSGGFVPLSLVWLIAAPALVVLAMFVALAKGKPAEYARFALLTDTALCLAGVAFCWLLLRSGVGRAFMLAALLVGVAIPGAIYLGHFIADTKQPTTRLAEAKRLADLNAQGMTRLALVAEPAPYVMPPVDLWRWQIELLPRGQDPERSVMNVAGSQVLLRAMDRIPDRVLGRFAQMEPVVPTRLLSAPAPISWAAKPFEVLLVRIRPIWMPSAATSPSQTPAPP